MLGRISIGRHLVAGAAIGGSALSTWAGVTGGGDLPERFET